MVDHKDILTTAAATLNDRGQQYGDADACFTRIAKLSSIILNKEITRYDVAMILHAVKLGRLQESRSKPDNYVDGINYLAFGAEFSQDHRVDDDVTEIALRFAPRRRNTIVPDEINPDIQPGG